MALDEPRNEDEVIEENGTKFVIEKDLLNQAKPISIDFINTPEGAGFKLTSNFTPAEGGCCGTCSC